MEFGKIKWCGGYNYTKGKENNFGFILSEDNKDLYFNRKIVYKTDWYVLKEKMNIIFEKKGDNVIYLSLLKDCDKVDYIDELLKKYKENSDKIKQIFLNNNNYSDTQSIIYYFEQNQKITKNEFIGNFKNIEKIAEIIIKFQPELKLEYFLLKINQSEFNNETFFLLDEEIKNNKLLNFEYSDIYEELYSKFENEIIIIKYLELLKDNDFDNYYKQIMLIYFNNESEDLSLNKKLIHINKKSNIEINKNELYSLSLKFLNKHKHDSEKEVNNNIGYINKAIMFICQNYKRQDEKNIFNIIANFKNSAEISEIYYNNFDFSIEIWKDLPRDSKIYYIYLVLSQNKIDYELIDYKDKDPLITILLKLFMICKDPNNKEKYFLEFHSTFVNYVSKNAWEIKSDELFLFLPRCTKESEINYYKNQRLNFCTPRNWKRKLNNENNDYELSAFCPNIRNNCDIGFSLLENTNFSKEVKFNNWSLYEVFNKLKISEIALKVLPDLRRSVDKNYVFALTGWIVRLFQIRERLICSKCKELMQPNMEYSKNIAAYYCTVVSCKNKCSENINVYLNHCKGCQNIIDSRESKFKDEQNYYICISCGSGYNKEPKNCPKCGKESLIGYTEKRQNFSKYKMKCTKCNHIITPVSKR